MVGSMLPLSISFDDLIAAGGPMAKVREAAAETARQEAALWAEVVADMIVQCAGDHVGRSRRVACPLPLMHATDPQLERILPCLRIAAISSAVYRIGSSFFDISRPPE